MNKKKIKIIGFIPAKKNSKDLKNKNFRKINNLSLFELAILNAKKSKFIEKIYLSSDSDMILNKGKEHKVNIIKRKKSLYMRPPRAWAPGLPGGRELTRHMDHRCVFTCVSSCFSNVVSHDM